MRCEGCEGTAIRWGKDRQENQRWKCKGCGVTWTDLPAASPIAPMRLPMDRAVLVLSLMVEGMSIRSAERVTGHHRDTIMRLMVLAGRKCERLLDSLVKGVEVEDVEADEIWGYVGMKERTKAKRGIVSAELGDAYTFVGIERNTKLALAHHVGRRTWEDADLFMSKLTKATAGPFQLTTDGFDGYPAAVFMHLAHRADYAMLIKEFGQDAEGARRYSPPRIIGAKRKYVNRFPDPDRVCTSIVERQNLTMRMQSRRLTRLTNGFSKKVDNLRAAMALHFAHYNLCRFHSSIRMTPAMKAGLVRAPWGVADLLAA
jgi:transposase-like protein/IS1 family transposase